MITEDRLQKILDFYAFDGALTEVKAFGNGHINDTILLRFDVNGAEKKYVLQKINKYVERGSFDDRTLVVVTM